MGLTTVFDAVSGGTGMSEYGNRGGIDTARLWTGGLATAVVAGLVVLVGALVMRGVLTMPILASDEAGYFGDAGTAVYAGIAAVAALSATGLLHQLLLNAPRPMTFFGWIVGLATVVAAISPFAQDAPIPNQIATALVNAITGIAIMSLLASVGASALRRAHGQRPRLHGEGALPDIGYESGFRDAAEGPTHHRGDRDPDAGARGLDG